MAFSKKKDGSEPKKLAGPSLALKYIWMCWTAYIASVTSILLFGLLIVHGPFGHEYIANNTGNSDNVLLSLMVNIDRWPATTTFIVLFIIMMIVAIVRSTLRKRRITQTLPPRPTQPPI